MPVLRSFTGRALISGVALKALALAGTAFGLPVGLALVDRIADLALLVGVGGVVFALLRLARRRLLWRVRRQLIISYIFIGFVPVLLLAAFFLLAGLLLFANIGSYFLQESVTLVVAEAQEAAEDGARAVSTAADPQALQNALAQVVAERRQAFPGVSLTVVPAATCGAPAVAAGTGTSGAWAHQPAPTALPVWVPCQTRTTVVVAAADTGLFVPRAVVRAVVPVTITGRRGLLVLDVPLEAALRVRLGPASGVEVGRVTAPPPPSRRGPPPRQSAPPTTEDARLTEVVRWVSFVGYTEWDTGRPGTAGVVLGLNIGRLYTRISATPLADLGNFTLGQLLLGGLLIVAVLFLIIQVVAFVLGVSLARSITGSVHALSEGTERVRAGDFSHRIQVQRRDQFGDLAESFNTMTASIETLLVERAEKQRLEQELRIARQIQMSLLPQGLLTLPGLVVAGHCEPAREVGGDYYDFLPLGPSRAGILIADVAGKGTSAALYMAELKGVVHSLSRRCASPRELLIEANRIIAPHLDDRSFITMTYAVVDCDARTFTYARAGHCPLVYVRGPGHTGDGPRSAVLAPSGMVLGLKIDGGEMFARVLEEVTLPLGHEDVIVMFTDGITEAMDTQGEYFGESRLQTLVEAHGHGDVETLRERILRDIEDFTGEAPQHDDMTMLVLKVESPR